MATIAMFVRVGESTGRVKPEGSNRVGFALRGWRASALALLLLIPAATGHAETAPTDAEQYMLALINRARSDPNGEAARFGMGLNDDLTPEQGEISAAPKPPLAMNDLLIDSALDHSDWMLVEDIFSHEGEGGSSPGDRMEDAGYVASYWGENLAWQGTSQSGPLSSTDIIQMVEAAHEGLFRSPGHRLNTMRTSFREVGIGILTGLFYYDKADWNAVMVTQKFARQNGIYCLTGVAFDDIDGNRFYTPGEGFGGIRISAVRHSDNEVFQTETWDTGGFALDLPNGMYDVVASGDDFGIRWVSDVLMANSNVEVNFVPEPGGSARAVALALSLLILRRRGRH